MKNFDRKKFGKLLAWSGDNFVYEHGDNHVIKLSKFDYILGSKKALQAKENDLDFFNSKFKDFFAETEIVRNRRKEKYAFLQQKIEGVPLKQMHLKNNVTRDRFIELFSLYQETIAEGSYPIDLIGGLGVRGRTLSNVFVKTDGSIALIDCFVMDCRRFPMIFRQPLRVLFYGGQVMQEHRAKKFISTAEKLNNSFRDQVLK